MYAYELCRKYHEAVNQKNLAATLKLFAPGATAKAPLSDVVDVEEFHIRLFECSRRGTSKLLDVFEGLRTSGHVAMRFHYSHILATKTIELDGMTVFEYDENSRRFEGLTMIYDPSPLLRHSEERRESLSAFA